VGVASAFGCDDRALDGKTDSDLPPATCDEDGAESFGQGGFTEEEATALADRLGG